MLKTACIGAAILRCGKTSLAAYVATLHHCGILAQGSKA
jgi:hypothetical protein